MILRVILACLFILAYSGCASTKHKAAPNPERLEAVSHTFVTQFMDVTAKAGIHFRHQNSGTREKYMLETMGSGCGFIDYDGDGFPDILLLNGCAIDRKSVV